MTLHTGPPKVTAGGRLIKPTGGRGGGSGLNDGRGKGSDMGYGYEYEYIYSDLG